MQGFLCQGTDEVHIVGDEDQCSFIVLQSLRFCPEPLLHLVKRPPERLPHSSGSGGKNSFRGIPDQPGLFPLPSNIQQTLQAFRTRKARTTPYKTLQDIQKDIRHFLQLQDKLNDAEKEKEDALIEKMKKRMEMLDNRCRQEGKRRLRPLYGSAALKTFWKIRMNSAAW